MDRVNCEKIHSSCYEYYQRKVQKEHYYDTSCLQKNDQAKRNLTYLFVRLSHWLFVNIRKRNVVCHVYNIDTKGLYDSDIRAQDEAEPDNELKI